MSDFSLFEKAISQYEKIKLSEESSVTDGSENEYCSHKNVLNENGTLTCTDCGEEINKTIMHEKEWRYYGPSDSKRTSDPSRVQIRKCEDRNIHKDVENMGFSEKIVSVANNIYNDVTKGNIFRGDSRKAIIFACIFHAYKLEGKPQPHDKLIKIFSLTRKVGLKGLKHVNLNADRDSKIHTTYITPVHLVDEIMSQFSASDNQKKEVFDLYEKIKNRSSKLNRARPQSVASGLIYYWICKKGLDISLKEFAQKADLSELTISKIAKEIGEVLGTPNLI